MAQLPGDLILGRNGDNGASTALRSLFTRNPAKSLPVESNGGGPIPGGVVEPLPKPPHMGDRVRTDPGGIFGRIWFLPFREPISLGETPAMRLAYREMMRSPFVKAGVLTKVLAVASQDWQIQPADDENPRDQQVAKFVKHVFEGMQGGLHEAIIQCLVPTLLDGYGLAEKVWGLEERGTYRGSVIGHLKQKDTQYFQLIGTPERVVDQFYLWRTGESFPPETFLYTRYLPIYDSPTGMSDMRAAYADYWMLDTVTKLRAIAAEKFTLPFMLGKWTNKEDKSPLENALQNARGATWMAVPQGVQVEAIQIAQKSEGDFKSFVDDCQKRILIAILGAYLQTLEGQINNGRGNTKVSKSITELFGWYLSCLFQQAINEQFIPDLIDYNFRNVGYPKLTLGAISGEEITQLLAQFESAERIGLQVSKKDAYSRLSIQPPEDPNDVLTPQGQLRPMNKDGIPSKRVGMGGLGGPIPGGDQPPPDGQTAGQIPGGPQNPQGQQGPPQANGKPPFKPTGIQSSNTPDPADSNAGVGDTRDLAEWYAQHWNDLRDMGTGPDDGELNAAGSELQDGDWVLTQDGDDGPYYVIHSDDHAGVEVQTFAAQHSPKGGVSIGGKFYRGGMWIPGKEIEKADAETKEKIEKGKEAAHDERRARGPVNLEQLHGSLEEHANAHELTKQEKGNVGRSYAALKRHHGELLGHRLEELAKTIKEAHDHPDATEGQKDQFSRRLAGLHAMIGRARAEGITGNVAPKVKAEAKPKVEEKPAEKKEEAKPTSGVKDFSKVDKAKVDDKKYEEAKKVDPDSVHLFKHGNAYHLWNDDANGVGKDIGLTVTNRGKTDGAVIFDHRLKENLDKISDLGKNVVVHDGSSHQEYPAKQKKEAKVEPKPTEQPAQVQPTPKQEQPAATQTTPEVKPDADKVQGGKEPWQMTQDEYAKRPVEPRKVPDLKRMYGSNGPTPQQEIEYKDLKRKYSADKKQFDKDYQEYLGKAYGDGNHESQVRKAVEEGKPVPAEVLADYPDLQAKYAKPTAETKPEPVAQTPTVKPDATASTQTQTPKLNSIRDLYQSPTDTDATVERVQSQGKPPDAQQIAELKKYTGTGNYHRVLNNILRGDSQATEAQQKAIDSVSDYIKSQPPLTEPIPVYRGMKFKTAGEMQNFLDSLKKSHESGEPLTLKGFTSSSPSAITAKTFIKPDGKSNVFMKIDATHGAMLPKSVNDQEAEFLMNHGSQFEVSHISEAPVPTGKGGSAYVVTMKQKPPTTQTQTPAKVEPKTPPQVQTQPKKVAPVKLTPKATPAKVEAKPVEQKPANPVEPPKKVEPAKPTFTPPPKVNQHQGDDYSTNVMSRVMAEMGFRPDTLTDEQADKVAEKVRSIPSREATNQNIQGRQVMSAIYDIKDAWERAKYDPKGGIGEASQNPTTATTTTPTESPVTTTSPQQAKPEAPKKVATDAMRKANPTGDNTQGIIGRDKRGQKETQIDDANGAKVAADLGDDLRKAWQESTLFQEHSDGLVPVDFLYRKVKKEHPDLTMPAFQDALSHLNEKRQLQLHIQNEVHMLKNPNQAIWKDGQAYNYVLMNKPGSQSAQTTGGTTSTAPQQTTPKQSPKNPATTVDNSRKDATIVDSEPVKPNGDAKVENATNVHDVLKSAKEALATHQKKGKNYGKSATDVELGGLSKDDPDWEREEFRLHRAVQDAETAVRAAARNATSAVQPPAEKKTANPEQPVIIRGNTFDVKEKLGKIPGAKYDKHKKVWVVPAKHADEARKLVASAPKKDNSALLKMSNAELAELGLIRDRGSKGPFVRRGTEEELKDYL